jgi:hypothetical protein
MYCTASRSCPEGANPACPGRRRRHSLIWTRTELDFLHPLVNNPTITYVSNRYSGVLTLPVCCVAAPAGR